MLLRYFYDEKLAHASYLVGCQATGEAVVIDPSRDIQSYVEVAEKEGLRLTAAAETHIHADFVAGSRELAHAFDATLYLSDEGDADWKYQNLAGMKHELLKDGDVFTIGNLDFQVMHTPGHTPESISFILTDKGGGANRPIGVFTGDFVFVGDVGRPDLLEKAAGQSGTADAGAHAMFHSLERFKELPDFLQVWPAHGAGSACGKALGAVPSSTVGYEKLFNWALQYTDETQFVEALLEGQPEPPKYFAVMKHVNKVGLPLLKDLDEPENFTSITQLEAILEKGHLVLDLRPASAFAKGHLPGTINIPYGKSFTNWAGWIVNYDEPLYLLTDKSQLDDVYRALHSIGIDKIAGVMDVEKAIDEAGDLETYDELTPTEALAEVEKGEMNVLDVRNQTEWDESHIPGASHIMLGTLMDRIDEVKTDKPLLMQCGSGLRSAIGASILQANGIKNIYNLTGGFTAWQNETDLVTK
ncbi:MBL fold metallo-hydrolase [Bacillus tianshenii]|nr:MBL fold metallo-hydrolase [Bacillus tianshenii]